jgi:hypothetical protein
MKTITNTLFLALLSVTLLLGACSGKKTQDQTEEVTIDIAALQAQYQVLNHFSQPVADTLLLDIVTYIGKNRHKPVKPHGFNQNSEPIFATRCQDITLYIIM